MVAPASRFSNTADTGISVSLEDPGAAQSTRHAFYSGALRPVESSHVVALPSQYPFSKQGSQPAVGPRRCGRYHGLLSSNDATLQQRPRYTLEDLLAQCHPNALRSEEEREWLDDKPAGGELI